jgi:hypothetical protein
MPQKKLMEYAQGRVSHTIDISEYNHKLSLVDFRTTLQPNRSMPDRRRTSFEDLVYNDKEGFRHRIIDAFLAKVTKLNVIDFPSFQEAFRQIFQNDTGGGRNFYGELSGQNDLLMRIFTDQKVQEMITEKGRERRTKGLMHRYGLNKQTAGQLYDQIRRTEIEQVSKGFIPEDMLKQPRLLRSFTRPHGRQISQRAQSGILYRRSEPRPFDDRQVRYLLNNVNLPAKKLTAEFNILFNEQRTRNSVYFKQYRLLKESGRARVGRLWAEPEPDNDMFFT